MDKLNTDELFSLAIQLDLPDLLAMCQTSKRFQESVCQRNSIWTYRLEQDFPEDQNLTKVLTPKEKFILLYKFDQFRKKVGINQDLFHLYHEKELDLNARNLTDIPREIGVLKNLLI